jgi:hypothetical protein
VGRIYGVIIQASETFLGKYQFSPCLNLNLARTGLWSECLKSSV